MTERLDVDIIFGASTKSARMRSGISQERLAEMTDSSRSSIMRIESGGATTLDLALRISEALDLRLVDLLPREKHNDDFLFHTIRANVLRLMISYISESGRPLLAARNLCVAIARHSRVLESVNRVFDCVEDGKSLEAAFALEPDLCGGLHELFGISAEGGSLHILDEVIRDAETQALIAARSAGSIS